MKTLGEVFPEPGVLMDVNVDGLGRVLDQGLKKRSASLSWTDQPKECHLLKFLPLPQK